MSKGKYKRTMMQKEIARNQTLLRWTDPAYREKVSKALKGKIPWNKGIPRTQETKDKISAKNIGRKHTITTRKKMSLSHQGKEFSENHKKSIRETPNAGRFKKGQSQSPKTEFKKGNIPWDKGQKRPEMSGELNSSWKGGRGKLSEMIRNLLEYTQWRVLIFKRDNYTCQECIQKSGNLEAHHHKKPFAQILSEFLQEYNQFSPIEDKETLARIAIGYKPFWDIDDGETLCMKCHSKTKAKKR